MLLLILLILIISLGGGLLRPCSLGGWGRCGNWGRFHFGDRPDPVPAGVLAKVAMAIGDKVGLEAAEKLQATVDDVQADLDRRTAAILALLKGKRVKFTGYIEIEDKEPEKP